MSNSDVFATASACSSVTEGHDLDAWLQSYRFLRNRLYGVAETPAEYVVAQPRLYLETTIPSYLTARPNRDPVTGRLQRMTRQWWDSQRAGFDIFISDRVIGEATAGNADAARRRRDVLGPFIQLQEDDRSRRLSRRLLTEGRLPERAAADAAHIAIAAVHAMKFLLTWNCRHLANAELAPRIMYICLVEGYTCPLIRTPEKLLESHPHERSDS